MTCNPPIGDTLSHDGPSCDDPRELVVCEASSLRAESIFIVGDEFYLAACDVDEAFLVALAAWCRRLAKYVGAKVDQMQRLGHALEVRYGITCDDSIFVVKRKDGRDVVSRLSA